MSAAGSARVKHEPDDPPPSPGTGTGRKSSASGASSAVASAKTPSPRAPSAPQGSGSASSSRANPPEAQGQEKRAKAPAESPTHYSATSPTHPGAPPPIASANTSITAASTKHTGSRMAAGKGGGAAGASRGGANGGLNGNSGLGNNTNGHANRSNTTNSSPLLGSSSNSPPSTKSDSAGGDASVSASTSGRRMSGHGLRRSPTRGSSAASPGGDHGRSGVVEDSPEDSRKRPHPETTPPQSQKRARVLHMGAGPAPSTNGGLTASSSSSSIIDAKGQMTSSSSASSTSSLASSSEMDADGDDQEVDEDGQVGETGENRADGQRTSSDGRNVGASRRGRAGSRVARKDSSGSDESPRQIDGNDTAEEGEDGTGTDDRPEGEEGHAGDKSADETANDDEGPTMTKEEKLHVVEAELAAVRAGTHEALLSHYAVIDGRAEKRCSLVNRMHDMQVAEVNRVLEAERKAALDDIAEQQRRLRKRLLEQLGLRRIAAGFEAGKRGIVVPGSNLGHNDEDDLTYAGLEAELLVPAQHVLPYTTLQNTTIGESVAAVGAVLRRNCIVVPGIVPGEENAFADYPAHARPDPVAAATWVPLIAPDAAAAAQDTAELRLALQQLRGGSISTPTSVKMS